MKSGERILLEIEVDAHSFRVTDRQTGSVVISVNSSCRGLPLHLFSQIRDVLMEIVGGYVSGIMDRE